MKKINLFLSTEYLEILDNCYQASWAGIDQKYYPLYDKLSEMNYELVVNNVPDNEQIIDGKIKITLTEKEYEDFLESIDILIEAMGEGDYEIMNHKKWEDRHTIIEGVKCELLQAKIIEL